MNEQDINTAVARMTECMTFFPASPIFRGELAALLPRMIGAGDIKSAGMMYTPKMRLEWLTEVMIHGVGKWPDEGLRELRGVYCCKFKPADGREENSTLRGFSPEDSESGARSSFLSPALQEQPYLPQPGDEPIGDLQKQITAAAKRLQ